MKQEVTNFGRFYSAFRRLRIHGDPEETKRQLVAQYTGGRTESLREIRPKEYTALCEAVERMNGDRDELKYRRSIVLKLLQELEVDTTDWVQINDFCRHPRIAGREFGRLSIDDLMDLARKLRSIKRKGWVRRSSWPEPQPMKHHIAYLISLAGNPGTKGN